jgi:hypothetical protein
MGGRRRLGLRQRTERVPLGLLTNCSSSSVKLPRRDRWSVRNSTVSPAVQGRWDQGRWARLIGLLGHPVGGGEGGGEE